MRSRLIQAEWEGEDTNGGRRDGDILEPVMDW